MLKPIVTMTAMLLLAALPAQAVTIINMDDQAHELVLEENTGTQSTRPIAAGETLRFMQAYGTIATQAFPNARLMIRKNDLLVIWPSGKLHLQKRRDFGKSS